jgi:tripartite-type tricarboxylate transporter receptor subunit TctC
MQFRKNCGIASLARRAIACGLLCITAVATPALAQDKYPTRPIRMVVGFTPGGGPDLIARLMAPVLANLLGVQVVVDNRGGAGGMIADEIVLNSVPDGYTVLACSNSISINPFLKKLPYDFQRDFIPISLTGISAQALVARPNFPVKSVQDVIALAKAKPRQLTIASSGIGAGSHLSAELFQLLTGIELVHVPYKGGGQGVAAVLAGETNLMFAALAPAIPQMKAGRLHAMAVTTAKRSVVAPEIPTMIEAGVPKYESFPWYGLLVPAKTPKPVVDALVKATADALKQADMRERMFTIGIEPPEAGPKEFSRFLKVEMDRWSQVIRKAKITTM